MNINIIQFFIISNCGHMDSNKEKMASERNNTKKIYCYKCGVENRYTANFCKHCGEKIPALKELILDNNKYNSENFSNLSKNEHVSIQKRKSDSDSIFKSTDKNRVEIIKNKEKSEKGKYSEEVNDEFKKIKIESENLNKKFLPETNSTTPNEKRGNIETDLTQKTKQLLSTREESLLKNEVDDANAQNESKLFEEEKTSADDDASHFLDINDIDKLDSNEFELFLKEFYKKMGYEIKKASSSEDRSLDLIIELFGEIIVVQGRICDSKVDKSSVNKIISSIEHYDTRNGMIVTNNYFTDSARDLARSNNNIKLIDREELKKKLKIYPVDKIELIDK